MSNLFISDEISDNLDISSIHTIGNSHSYEWEIWNNNTIIWTFDNIYLIDSTTSQLASQGFIQFKIAPKPGIDINTIIKNEANIHFAYNDPILTNNITLYHCDFIAIQSILVDNSNPTDCDLEDGIISIQVEASVNVEYSIDGGITWQAQNEFSNLAPGEYNILIRDQSGNSISEYESNPIIISPQTLPILNDIQVNNPLSYNSEDSIITINAEGSQPLVYSIDGGLNWQTSNTFEGLSSGSYQILVQFENETCQISSGELVLMGSFGINDLTTPIKFRIFPNSEKEKFFYP